jgi:hypothetical protein
MTFIATLPVALAALAFPAARDAWATEVAPAGHIALEAGGAAGPVAGPRVGLDVAFAAAFVEPEGGEAPVPFTSASGWLLGGAVMVSAASYAAAEVGYLSYGLFGCSATIGPAVRYLPSGSAAVGGEASAAVELFLLHVGFRVVSVSDGDTQVTAVIGIGTE